MKDDGGQRRYGPLGRALVIIPTYNEAENIKPIVARVRAAVPEAHVLVADDNSPDGTGKFADETRRRGRPGPRAAPQGQGRPRRRLPGGLPLGHRARLRRPGRDGRRRLPPARGTAPAAHRAQGRRPGARLPLGARRPDRELAQVPRVHLARRHPPTPGCCSASRSATSPAATAPSGARPSKASAWTRSPPPATASRSTWPAGRSSAGFHVVEVPITFVERERGDSKMSNDILVEALWRVTAWGVRLARQQDSWAASPPDGPRGGYDRRV